MPFSFSPSLSGLNAQTNALGVIGNNISNAGTVGFRSNSVTFSDIFASAGGARLNGAGGSLQVGHGVRTAAIHTDFTQGNLNEAGSPLQSAIQGNGFFVVRDNNGSLGYTRAGDFSVNNQGYLVTPTGGQVQGYGAVNGVIPTGAALTSLRLPIGQTLPPNITTNASLRMNLNSAATTGANFNATVHVFDSLGGDHTMNLSFTRQANGSYQMTANLDNNPAQTSVNGGAATSNPVTFTFDSNGNPTAPTSLSIIPDQTQLNGASLPAIRLNLRDTNPDGTPGAALITSFARDSAVSSTIQDGYQAGELNSASIDPNGNIVGTYSNGQTRLIGQYALANFNAPEGLSHSGDNLFAETPTSGQATIGTPNTGGRGSIAGGYLEQSNVNLTNEFVDLIEAQRGFQANSKVITTVNQTFQELLQII